MPRCCSGRRLGHCRIGPLSKSERSSLWTNQALSSLPLVQCLCGPLGINGRPSLAVPFVERSDGGRLGFRGPATKTADATHKARRSRHVATGGQFKGLKECSWWSRVEWDWGSTPLRSTSLPCSHHPSRDNGTSLQLHFGHGVPGRGKIRRGFISCGKLRISNWCENSPAFSEGWCEIFAISKFSVGHLSTTLRQLVVRQFSFIGGPSFPSPAPVVAKVLASFRVNHGRKHLKGPKSDPKLPRFQSQPPPILLQPVSVGALRTCTSLH